jgi:DNA-binding transcriptional MerR regulator
MARFVATAAPVAKDPPEIPGKLYFRIGEVAELVGVKQHVLRFWETQFPHLAPKKSGSGQRLYRRKDVQTLLEIKELLHARRFTIEGAKQQLSASSSLKRTPKAAKAVAPTPPPRQDSLFATIDRETVAAVRQELGEILRLLDS